MKTGAHTSDGSGLLYRSPFVYAVSSSGALSLESVAVPCGRLTPSGPRYHVTDHLGSVVAVVDGSSGASLTDFGARHYSPALRRWLTPDPLCENYYDTSPYVYCDADPVNIVDPEGKKIYFAKGSTEAFKQRFAEAIKIMNDKGTSYNIAKLEASDMVFYIKENDKNKYVPSRRTILWNPTKLGFDDDTYILRSPMTTLAHEAAHANNHRESIEEGRGDEYEWLYSTTDSQYTNLEERRVIITTEQYAARRHGEISGNQVTRKKHYNIESDDRTYPDFSILTMEQILYYVAFENRLLFETNCY